MKRKKSNYISPCTGQWRRGGQNWTCRLILIPESGRSRLMVNLSVYSRSCAPSTHRCRDLFAVEYPVHLQRSCRAGRWRSVFGRRGTKEPRRLELQSFCSPGRQLLGSATERNGTCFSCTQESIVLNKFNHKPRALKSTYDPVLGEPRKYNNLIEMEVNPTTMCMHLLTQVGTI